jgi:SAM-dependent methyltransferase
VTNFFTIAPQWSSIGVPLRPAAEDTAAVQRVIDTLAPMPRVVVLGLTPETIGCTWPAGTELAAVDHSEAMMRALWPPNRAPANSHAVFADWQRMPFVSASADFVAGDGCYMLFSYPEGFEALTREVSRILRPAGRFVIRVFLRPERMESVDEIAAEVREGSVGSVHALKLRLYAARHGSGGEGVRLFDVWRAWKRLPPPPPWIAGRAGWMPDEIAGIERYRDLDSCFYLPTRAEMRAILTPLFTELECVTGTYELAERCATFVLSRNEEPAD